MNIPENNPKVDKPFKSHSADYIRPEITVPQKSKSADAVLSIPQEVSEQVANAEENNPEKSLSVEDDQKLTNEPLKSSISESSNQENNPETNDLTKLQSGVEDSPVNFDGAQDINDLIKSPNSDEGQIGPDSEVTVPETLEGADTVLPSPQEASEQVANAEENNPEKSLSVEDDQKLTNEPLKSSISESSNQENNPETNDLTKLQSGVEDSPVNFDGAQDINDLIKSPNSDEGQIGPDSEVTVPETLEGADTILPSPQEASEQVANAEENNPEKSLSVEDDQKLTNEPLKSSISESSNQENNPETNDLTKLQSGVEDSPVNFDGAQDINDLIKSPNSDEGQIAPNSDFENVPDSYNDKSQSPVPEKSKLTILP
ncbi:unnamed protein product, partial [Hymenolepis diminuta]|uniref:PAM2 domain-containing protein n=1 Tax=Hymenolepis diminuta TaxID=6216 RepID=A0A0R3SNW7_HYMDI